MNEDSDHLRYSTAEQSVCFPLTSRGWAKEREDTELLWLLLLTWQKTTNSSVSHQTFSNSIFKENTDVAFHSFKIKACPEKKKEEANSRSVTQTLLDYATRKQRYLSEFPLIMRACKFIFVHDCLQKQFLSPYIIKVLPGLFFFLNGTFFKPINANFIFKDYNFFTF